MGWIKLLMFAHIYRSFKAILYSYCYPLSKQTLIQPAHIDLLSVKKPKLFFFGTYIIIYFIKNYFNTSNLKFKSLLHIISHILIMLRTIQIVCITKCEIKKKKIRHIILLHTGFSDKTKIKSWYLKSFQVLTLIWW